MTFPSGTTINTANLAAGTGNPSLARADLLAAVQAINNIIEEPNTAGNAVVLDSNALIPSTSIPSVIVTTNTLTLSPATGVVKIEDYLRLQIVPKATVLANTDQALGDLVLYADDLTGANAGIAMYDGTNWKIISVLDDLTTLS